MIYPTTLFLCLSFSHQRNPKHNFYCKKTSCRQSTQNPQLFHICQIVLHTRHAETLNQYTIDPPPLYSSPPLLKPKITTLETVVVTLPSTNSRANFHLSISIALPQLFHKAANLLKFQNRTHLKYTFLPTLHTKIQQQLKHKKNDTMLYK